MKYTWGAVVILFAATAPHALQLPARDPSHADASRPNTEAISADSLWCIIWNDPQRMENWFGRGVYVWARIDVVDASNEQRRAIRGLYYRVMTGSDRCGFVTLHFPQGCGAENLAVGQLVIVRGEVGMMSPGGGLMIGDCELLNR